MAHRWAVVRPHTHMTARLGRNTPTPLLMAPHRCCCSCRPSSNAPDGCTPGNLLQLLLHTPRPRTCWLMLLVRPLSISCLCRNTAIRADPRPLSSSGRPSAPCVSAATRVDLPLSMLPATAGRHKTCKGQDTHGAAATAPPGVRTTAQLSSSMTVRSGPGSDMMHGAGRSSAWCQAGHTPACAAAAAAVASAVSAPATLLSVARMSSSASALMCSSAAVRPKPPGTNSTRRAVACAGQRCSRCLQHDNIWGSWLLCLSMRPPPILPPTMAAAAAAVTVSVG